MAYTVQDLPIGDALQGKLSAALASASNPEPWTNIVAAAEAEVSSYTAQFDVPEALLKDRIAQVAIYRAYTLVGPIPANVKEAYDAAVAWLKDVRDGKFAFEPAADPPAASAGAWGSEDQISAR